MRGWFGLLLFLGWLIAAGAVPAEAAAPTLASVFHPAHADRDLVLPKWDRVLRRTAAEACPAAAPSCTAWRRLAARLAGTRDRADLLARVNRAANALRYRPDGDGRPGSDHWATPAEFFAGGGDCEDFAIAKFFLLRALGVPDSAMRIAMVQDMRRRLMHAVLLVETDAGPVVLDNVTSAIVPAARMAHYRPLFAVNTLSSWGFLDGGSVGTAAR